jgi:hypothetical protein
MFQDLPTKRRGLDWTLGEEAVKFGRANGMDYALFLYAQDSVASSGRIALQVVGIAGCFIGFCAPQNGGSQTAFASLVDLKTGDVVWFNVPTDRRPAPGRQLRRSSYAGRSEPDGRAPAWKDEGRPQRQEARRMNDILTRRMLLGGSAAPAARARRTRFGADRAAHDEAAHHVRLRPDETDEKGPLAAI